MNKTEACAAVNAELGLIATDLEARMRQEEAFRTRWGSVEDVRTLKGMQVHLPQGADATANEVLERLEALERRYAAPNLFTADYDEGVALLDDEVQVLRGNHALVTAEHATNPVRKDSGRREGADQGTAALAAAMAGDDLAAALIMTGRQLGNAGVTPNHPLKLLALRSLTSSHHGFLSIHSKFPGQAPSLFEEREVHAYIGLGRYEPRKSTLTAADQLVAAGADLGLRVMIGNNTFHPLYKTDPDWRTHGRMSNKLNELTLDDNDQPKLSRLGGISAESTTSWLMRATEGDPVHGEMPIMQLEISTALCITALDRYQRDRKALAMGVYAGYLLTSAATRIIGQGGR